MCLHFDFVFVCWTSAASNLAGLEGNVVPGVFNGCGGFALGCAHGTTRVRGAPQDCSATLPLRSYVWLLPPNSYRPAQTSPHLCTPKSTPQLQLFPQPTATATA